MTAAEAVAAAAAEGLELVRAENSSGFKGVKRSTKHINKPFQAVPYGGGGRAGKTLYLGSFATAEEAALAVARALAAKAAAEEEEVAEVEEEEVMEVDDDDDEEEGGRGRGGGGGGRGGGDDGGHGGGARRRG